MQRGTTGLLLLGLLTLGACREQGNAAVRHADRLFAEGRAQEAADAYLALPAEAGDWQAYGAWRAAVIHRDALHDETRATDLFLACARGWADHEYGYTCRVELGDLHRDLGRPREAIDAYRTALQLRARGSFAEHCLFESGRMYLSLGEAEQARVEWKELLRTFPSTILAPQVELARARSFDLEGRHKDALTAYRAVQQARPNHSVAPLAALGEAGSLEQLGMLDEAAEVYERVVQAHPNPEAVLIKLRALRARQVRRDRAPTNQPDRYR